MDPCEFYWETSDWLPPGYILERWCQVNDRPCLEAKLQALLSACERGDVGYRRRDGKDFDDPVHELWSRRILLIERASFEAWVTALEGNSPLSIPPGSEAQRSAVLGAPPWAAASAIQPPLTGAADTPPAAMAELGLPVPPALAGSAVTSEAIIAAFRIHADADSNRQWWKTRMRDAPRYKLAICRVSVGGPNRGGQRQSSQWRPDLIAGWLVDKSHLSKTQAARVLRQHFPDWAHAADHLE